MASVNQIPERNLDVGHGTQNSLLANAHRILTAATPFCSLLPPLAALANVPLYTREPLGTGDADRRNQRPKFWNKIWLAVATPQARRPCGPPRNDNGFLSFRGAERRGNPSFLRWTGVRAAVPRAWPPPTKFRPEIWGVGQVVGPYGRSTEVPAVGRCGHRTLRKARSTTQASRRAAKRPRPRTRGMGENRRRGHQKGALPRDHPSSA